ncbi:MAG: hypothetical protein ABIO49_02580 [Dokdonella sp.]
MTPSRNRLLATVLILVAGGAQAVDWASPVDTFKADGKLVLSLTPAGAVADLSISIDNGTNEIETGQWVTYQIVASTNGPSSASATVGVDFPFGLSSCSWTCSASGGASCAASGSGNINETVNLPPPAGDLSNATFVATCFVDTSISMPPPATLSVPANVASSVSDPNLDDNAASDTDALIPVVDVAVSIDDGVPYTWFGRTLSYVMRIESEGSDAIVHLVNTVPSTLTNCNWTCQSIIGSFCPTPASGSGDIDVELTLPAWSGGLTELVRFTSTCTVSNTAISPVVNSAQLILSPPFRDPVTSNNQASDTDILKRTVDLSATLTDGQQYVPVGDMLNYVLRVDNAGPDNGDFTHVSDTLPSGVSDGFWTCTASAGATCHEGVGDILDDAIVIPVGGHVTYLFSGTVQPQTFTAPIANQALAISDVETFDPDANNNIATDSPPDIVVLFRADFD